MIHEVFLERLRLTKVLADMGLKIIDSDFDVHQRARDGYSHAIKLEERLSGVDIDFQFRFTRPAEFNGLISENIIPKLREYFLKAIQLVEKQEAYINE